ncbi:unnamed protein product [Dovyalis caffra]|uniref:Uncharacterized protein n=1 Tax=Dovyalis caffra TaxID=77055 RepID=A0AAV1S3S0_9ROSI|nr:unnamed protein product [Dovyalis caffra]
MIRKRESERRYREIANKENKLKVENEELRRKNFVLAEQRDFLNKKMLEDKLELEKLKRFLRQRKDFSPELLGNVSHETAGDVLQESDPVCQAHERNQDPICSRSAVDDVLMNEAENFGREFVQPVVRGSCWTMGNIRSWLMEDAGWSVGDWHCGRSDDSLAEWSKAPDLGSGPTARRPSYGLE